MKISVYGTGCDKCTQLYEVAKQASQELGIDADIEKVTEILDITMAGVVMTPALGVDGKIVLSGKVPDLVGMKKLLS